MRIIIDMQGAQTESRFRGIGRYTLSLVKAIIQNREDREIILILNGLFPDTIEPIRNTLNELLSQESFIIWYAPESVNAYHKNEWSRVAAELIREAFIEKLKPDIVLITSFFEGYCNNSFTSIGLFDKKTPVITILHDLIPYINSIEYLDPHPEFKLYYLRKIEQIKKTNYLFGISKSTTQEAIKYLRYHPKRVLNISGAIDKIFKKYDINIKEKKKLIDKFKINKHFIMYTGGSDPRKNLQRLIQAYASLDLNLRNNHQLVFVGKIPQNEIIILNDIAKKYKLKPWEFIITGYVTDEELTKLYNLCSLFVFPSWHEGFGLPALEAMACGAPVIGSNVTSIPEVIGLKDAMFNPFDVVSMTNIIKKGLVNCDFRKLLINNGKKQCKKFSWDVSARKAINAIDKVYRYNRVSNITNRDIYTELINAIANIKTNIEPSEMDIRTVAVAIDKSIKRT